MMTEIHARPSKSAAGDAAEDGADSEPVEKRQKPVDTKAAEKQRLQKKKSLKRL